jgi:hypothetical protein
MSIRLFKRSKNVDANNKVEDVTTCLREILSDVRGELNEHLEGINENTNEIQANYEYLCELDSKINKISEKLEEISLFVGLTKPCDITQGAIDSLTRKEKEVFYCLYTMTEEKEFVSYKDLARRLALTESLVMSYITNIISKRVPIMKRFVNNEAQLRISSEFRRLQAKQNVLGISELVTKKVFYD